jgi:uncharacterized protein YbaR (Trm112 family)
MPETSSLSDLLACPRCDGQALSPKQDGYRCKGCKTEFSGVGGIPWLFADPGSSLGGWRNRLHFSLQKLASEAQRIRAELTDKALGELTRQRLQHQADAIDVHRTALREILGPLELDAMQANYESHLALRTRLPVDQGIQTYAANIHRDWAWGAAENEASINEIRAVLGDTQASSLGDTLVLGAGACRLAYDLHMQLDASRTLAMDFNPLLLFIAQKVLAGDTVELHEFPLAPRSLEDFAVLQKLAAPAAVREGFHFVFGDVLRPPFAAAAFDTIVTPWIIDIVDEALPIQAARINCLLKPGGRWLNFGSLAFEHAQAARRYSAEETIAIIEQTGFATPRCRETEIPYMCSPSSRHGRQETVFTFCAGKIADVAAPGKHKALPDWLVTGKQPVPLLKSFQSQALSTRVYAYVMSLIDGRRSIGDMAKILEQQKLMTEQEAEPAIRKFLTRMHEDSQRKS